MPNGRCDGPNGRESRPDAYGRAFHACGTRVHTGKCGPRRCGSRCHASRRASTPPWKPRPFRTKVPHPASIRRAATTKGGNAETMARSDRGKGPFRRVECRFSSTSKRASTRRNARDAPGKRRPAPAKATPRLASWRVPRPESPLRPGESRHAMTNVPAPLFGRPGPDASVERVRAEPDTDLGFRTCPRPTVPATSPPDRDTSCSADSASPSSR
jgi:hypothetical protein